MLLSLRLRAAVSALSICALSACGGGGDDVSASAQNVLKPSSLEVLISDGNITAGKYPVDTVFVGASGTGTLGGKPVEWLDISIEGSTIKGQLIISAEDTNRYALMLVNDASPGDLYACRGNTPWSADQLAYLVAPTALEDLPVCGGNVQISRGKFHQFLALGLAVPNLASVGRFVSLNSELNWSPQPNAVNFDAPAEVEEVEEAAASAT